MWTQSPNFQDSLSYTNNAPGKLLLAELLCIGQDQGAQAT